MRAYRDEVSPAGPGPQDARHVPSPDPIPPAMLDDAGFEERAGEEDDGEEDDGSDVDEGERPVTQPMEGLGRTGSRPADQHDQRGHGAHEAGDTDDANTGADDGRIIT